MEKKIALLNANVDGHTYALRITQIGADEIKVKSLDGKESISFLDLAKIVARMLLDYKIDRKGMTIAEYLKESGIRKILRPRMTNAEGMFVACCLCKNDGELVENMAVNAKGHIWFVNLEKGFKMCDLLAFALALANAKNDVYKDRVKLDDLLADPVSSTLDTPVRVSELLGDMLGYIHIEEDAILL